MGADESKRQNDAEQCGFEQDSKKQRKKRRQENGQQQAAPWT